MQKCINNHTIPRKENFVKMQAKRVTYFGANLERKIAESGKTRTAVAEDLGINPTMLGGYIRGQLPNVAYALRIADYFGVSVYDMVLTPLYPQTAEEGARA